MLDDHSTVVPTGVAVATRLTVCPSPNTYVSLSKTTLCFSITVTAQLALAPFGVVAVIVAVPAATAVTLPF